MGRSLRKGPFVAYHLLKKVNEMNKTDKKTVIQTWSRASTIIPSMVDEKHVIWSKTADGTMVHLIEPPDGPGNDLVSFHVAFEVENFDETVEILKKSKYEITNGPQIRHDGQRAIYIQDMDGNTLEFTTHNNIQHSARIVDEWGYTKNS